MVFQQFNLFPHLTALDNVALPLRSVHGHEPGRDAHAQGGRVACARSGCCERAGHYPGPAVRRSAAAGGHRAGAQPVDPKVMLFDEPTSALDPELVGEVAASDARAGAEAGMTMVVVTHELGFAREIGDLNVFMDDGVVVETGSGELFDSPTSPRTQDFIRAVR